MNSPQRETSAELSLYEKLVAYAGLLKPKPTTKKK